MLQCYIAEVSFPTSGVRQRRGEQPRTVVQLVKPHGRPEWLALSSRCRGFSGAPPNSWSLWRVDLARPRRSRYMSFREWLGPCFDGMVHPMSEGMVMHCGKHGWHYGVCGTGQRLPPTPF
jgi:hypothetical protein